MTFLFRYRRSTLAVALGLVVWLASVALVVGQAPQPAVQMSEQVFKNVQVLKGIPVDEFMGTMGLFSAALTVCCGDCHTGAGTSNPEMGGRPAQEAHGAPDDPDGRGHQSRQLQRASGRDVLDVSSRQRAPHGHAAARQDVRRADDRAARRRSPPRRPASRRPIRFSTSTFRRSAAPRGWPSLTSYIAKGTAMPFGDSGRVPGGNLREGAESARDVRPPAGRRHGADVRRSSGLFHPAAHRRRGISVDGRRERRGQARRGAGVSRTNQTGPDQLARRLLDDSQRERSARRAGHWAVGAARRRSTSTRIRVCWCEWCGT